MSGICYPVALVKAAPSAEEMRSSHEETESIACRYFVVSIYLSSMEDCAAILHAVYKNYKLEESKICHVW